MATQAEIQALINEIQTNANYPATKMNPLLSSMLDFASAGQTQVFDGLVANNTTLSGTTLVLQYGVNIIETSTPTNFACKLPTPVTGKRVIIVNRSLMTVSLFPSMAGGQINNYPIDEPALIPPDGRAYDFICVENPLPGAWVWSPPATGQYDSGEITVTTTTNSFDSYICAASLGGTIFAAERQSLFNSNAFNGLNIPNVTQNTPAAFPNISYVARFKPATPWNSITKIKVYTNIVPAVGQTPTFTLTAGSQYNDYQAGTFTFVSSGIGGASNPFLQNEIILNNIIAGVVPAPGLTTNIGDDGTVWGEVALTPSMFLYNVNLTSFVGDQFISTDGTNDTWFTRFISAFLKHRVIGTVKFRFFIEFN
jgi:hypothetical protein